MLKKLGGFTLIELMVVVAIIGIIASIAIPSYQESMRKTRRADAQGALLNFANGMERHFTRVSSYCDAGGAGGANTCFPASVGELGVNDNGTPSASVFAPSGATAANYDFTIVNATANTFTLQATPVAAGPQATNGSMQLVHDGTRRWDRNNDGDYGDADELNWDN